MKRFRPLRVNVTSCPFSLDFNRIDGAFNQVPRICRYVCLIRMLVSVCTYSKLGDFLYMKARAIETPYVIDF